MPFALFGKEMTFWRSVAGCTVNVGSFLFSLYLTQIRGTTQIKKPLSKILIGIIAICAVSFICVYAAQSSKIVSEDGLIAKARTEIKNLAEVETIDMTIAGKSTIENNKHLFWIITGNEYQMHRYYPLEVIEVESGEYKFVRLHNGGTQRGQDIFFEDFGNGYSFVVNNPKCKGIVIGETTITVSEIPFVYYHPFVPKEYYFIDENGNELS